MIKTTQTAIRFSPRMAAMIKEIQKALGYTTQTAVIHQAIIDMYTTTFPVYLQKTKNKDKRLDPVEEAKYLQEQEDARVREEERKQEGICASLEGEVIDDNGRKLCKYFNYSGKKRFEQVVTIGQLNKSLIESQYYPTKQKVKKLQEEGKVDYEV